MEAELRQRWLDMSDSCARPETAQPIFIIKSVMVMSGEGADLLPKSAPPEYLGLDELPFLPPDMIEIEDFFE